MPAGPEGKISTNGAHTSERWSRKIICNNLNVQIEKTIHEWEKNDTE